MLDSFSTLAHRIDRIGAEVALVIWATTPIQAIPIYISSTDQSANGPCTNPITPMSQSTCFFRYTQRA